MLTIFLPAAGQSSRMKGSDKLLERIDGTPLLRMMVDRALKAADNVVVTIRADDPERAECLSETSARIVEVPRSECGFSASLKAGISSLDRESEAVMIVLPDMPDITALDMSTLWAVFSAGKNTILQAATPDGRPGHPVIFARKHFHEFDQLNGDIGAREIIERHAATHAMFPLSDNRATLDLDTPDAWTQWRDSNG